MSILLIFYLLITMSTYINRFVMYQDVKCLVFSGVGLLLTLHYGSEVASHLASLIQ